MSVDVNLLAKISADRALGSAMLFAHRHPQESAPMHVEMMDLWRCGDEFVLIEAFRDAGKSTIAEEAIAMEGCFGNFHYALLIGETYSKACQRLAAIDLEARRNVKLHHLFGGPVLARKSIENKMFFKSGAMIEAVGWEQELQSFKQGAHRPDLAWLDDIENQERVRDKETVTSNMRKFWLELVPALDKTRRRIRFTQTRRAEDCMVTRFISKGQWLYRGYPLCNGDIDDPGTKSLWPARWPMDGPDGVRAERDRFQADGMLQEFKQAYMLQVTDPTTKPFKDEQLQFRDVSAWHWMPRFAIYDPARTSNERRTKEVRKSDRYGKVVVSRMGSEILVHESSGNFWKPSECIEDLFLTNRKHSPAKLAIEKNSLDDWLLQPIRIEMLRRGEILPLVALTAPQDRSKDDFILGLQPFAQAGDIVLLGGRSAHPQLIAEWSNFPAGPRDILNALAYSLRMFSGTPVYGDFGGANVLEAPVPRRGETVYVGWNASPNETVAVACLREGRRIMVAFDGAAPGPEAVKTLVADIRAAFPLAIFSCWAPSEVHDQWQRIPLVSQLRGAHVMVYRAEHTAPARGGLSDRVRSDFRGRRLLTVDRRAKLTLNALATGYAVPVERGGRGAGEPEAGTSRLVAEALETMVAILDKSLEGESSIPKGANVGLTPSGAPYVTAAPRRIGG